MNVESVLKKHLPILYEDEWLVAVAKPAGVDAGCLPQKNAAPGVAEILGQLRGRGENLQPANRLSRFESGVLLLAKEPEVVREIRDGLRSRRISQEYVAIVAKPMKRPRIQIGSAHGQSRGRQRGPRGKRTGRPATPRTRGVELSTRIDRLKEGDRRAVVSCKTTVETTHALKAQLRSASLPLLGDPVGDRYRRHREHVTHLHLARLTFLHPRRGQTMTLHCPPPPHFDAPLSGQGGDEERILQAALVRRMPTLDEASSDAFRLLTGPAEGLPAIVFEKYASVGVMQYFEGRGEMGRAALKRIARWYSSHFDLQAVYFKPFVKDRVGAGDEVASDLTSPRPLLGTPVEEEITIREHDLKFAIRPYDGFSTGIFLDQRENRRRIRELAAGREVLNLFAYTCGFAVSAAAGGATGTESVDVAVKSLEWGKRNFELNGIPLDNHRFIRSDIREYFQRAQRQGRTFDMVILDAPTFAHSRGKGDDFSIKRDLVEVLREVLALLNEQGILLLSTNYRATSLTKLRQQLAQAAGPRKFRVMATPPLPLDYAIDPDHAKTIIARFQ